MTRQLCKRVSRTPLVMGLPIAYCETSFGVLPGLQIYHEQPLSLEQSCIMDCLPGSGRSTRSGKQGRVREEYANSRPHLGAAVLLNTGQGWTPAGGVPCLRENSPSRISQEWKYVSLLVKFPTSPFI